MFASQEKKMRHPSFARNITLKGRMTTEILIENEESLPQAVKEFISAMGSDRVFLFHGGMGAGKTTFISAVCRGLGVADDLAASPSFSIVNEYRLGDGSPVYHFDFYRVESDAEAADTGAEDYFYSGAPCFVEWPEKAEGILPAEAVDVWVEEQPDGSRKLTIER